MNNLYILELEIDLSREQMKTGKLNILQQQILALKKPNKQVTANCQNCGNLQIAKNNSKCRTRLFKSMQKRKGREEGN